MRLAYFDCFSGISGDMALAALVHAGADLEAIREALSAFRVDELSLEREEVDVRGISALRIQVRAGPQAVIQTHASIQSQLRHVGLSDRARRTAQLAYRRLAEAEARVHNKDPELVTFHDYGQVDLLVDFVGCSLALDLLHVDRVFASPVPTGLGMARTQHGIMPIPSPVVMELLQGVPTYSRGIPAELVTPSGAAILAAVSEGYGDMPMMRADQVGYGAGSLRLDFPNMVRVVVGEEQRAGATARPPASLEDLLSEGDLLIQVAVDDLARGNLESVMDGLTDAGAVEVWAAPVQGAGGRRLTVLSAVASAADRERVVQAVRDGCEGRNIGRIRITPVVTARTTR